MKASPVAWGRRAVRGERQSDEPAQPLFSAQQRPSPYPSSTRWLRDAGWEEDEPWEMQGEHVHVPEKPLAARCVVEAIACKALSVREESRVKCSPGPRDRCRRRRIPPVRFGAGRAG